MRPTAGRLAVVADDLTGAADASAPFAAYGADVGIALAWPPRAGIEVLAQVTDTRWRCAPEAAERTGAAVARALDWGAQRLFVKVDSTLRGNVGAEVDAALTAWGAGPAVVAVAFPAQGRVVRGGVLYVHGLDHGPVADHFPACVRVLDAETDEQLAAVAQQAVAGGAVLVGSGGLARALAATRSPAPARRTPPMSASGLLIVVGTTHPVSREQVRTLVAADIPRLAIGPSTPTDAAGLDRAIQTLAAGRTAIVTSDDGGPLANDPDTLASELAATVAKIAAAVPSIGLVLTGGATALGVASALGATETRVLGEFRPGVPVGALVLPDRHVPVMTKSGGFGDAGTLLDAARTLEASP